MAGAEGEVLRSGEAGPGSDLLAACDNQDCTLYITIQKVLSVLYLGDVGGQEEAGHRPPAGVVEDGAPQQRISAHRASALLLRAAGGSQLRGTWGQNIELMHVKPSHLYNFRQILTDFTKLLTTKN